MLSVDFTKYMNIIVHYVRVFFTQNKTLATFFLALAFGLCMSNVFAQTSTPNAIAPMSTSQNPYFNSNVALGNHQKKFYKACSIYVYVRSFLKVQVINLSTYKISSCPASEFGHITATSVIAQLQTIAPFTLVSMIGPYFQLMDENNSVIENQSISVGNLAFTQVMTAEVTVFDLFTNFNSVVKWKNADPSYNPIPTSRNMNFVWYKGSTIYTVTSPQGDRYVMVYYSPPDIDQYKNEQDVISKLAGLGNDLNLPPGWKYQTEVLSSILRLNQIVPEGFVSDTMMDELDNVYVRMKAGAR